MSVEVGGGAKEEDEEAQAAVQAPVQPQEEREESEAGPVEVPAVGEREQDVEEDEEVAEHQLLQPPCVRENEEEEATESCGGVRRQEVRAMTPPAVAVEGHAEAAIRKTRPEAAATRMPAMDTLPVRGADSPRPEVRPQQQPPPPPKSPSPLLAAKRPPSPAIEKEAVKVSKSC